MAMEQLTFDFDLEDVDVDWQDVARVFAEQLARTAEFDETLERLEHDASYRMRRWLQDEYDSHNAGWEVPYAAATMLREADERQPELRDRRSTEQVLHELRAAQRADAAEDDDPVETVLVSPRRRQNVIERIVYTHRGRVSAEYLHETGWRRFGMDLRTVMSGVPLARSDAEAMSRKPGVYDALPTEEILAECRRLDPNAPIGGPSAAAKAGRAEPLPYHYVKLRDVATATFRITDCEMRDDSRAHDLRFTGSDVTNAAIAAELLRTTRAIWRSVTLEVGAPADGPFVLSVFDTEDVSDRCKPSERLRALVARRYEAAETNQGRPWKKFTFVASRVELPEWKCDVSYTFA